MRRRPPPGLRQICTPAARLLRRYQLSADGVAPLPGPHHLAARRNIS